MYNKVTLRIYAHLFSQIYEYFLNIVSTFPKIYIYIYVYISNIDDI